MPINKATEKQPENQPKGFYAAVRRVQTQRSAATISDGCNILFNKPSTKRKTLLSQTTRLPVKGNITIPYGVFAGGNPTSKCATDNNCEDPMNSRTLTVMNYGCRFLTCADAMDDAPGLEDFYMNGLRNGLERTVDKNIIYTAAVGNGLVGIIGPSAAVATDAVARGVVAVNNETAGTVTMADIQTLISVIDPYSYNIEDLVILLNPTTWQGFIAVVGETACCGRINQAERTLDGFSVFLSPGIPAGQAGVAAIANYLVGVRKDLELTTCGTCDQTIKAKARLAGAMAGVGGALSTNTGTNIAPTVNEVVCSVEAGAEGVYAAYLTGVANS